MFQDWSGYAERKMQENQTGARYNASGIVSRRTKVRDASAVML